MVATVFNLLDCLARCHRPSSLRHSLNLLKEQTVTVFVTVVTPTSDATRHVCHMECEIELISGAGRLTDLMMVVMGIFVEDVWRVVVRLIVVCVFRRLISLG